MVFDTFSECTPFAVFWSVNDNALSGVSVVNEAGWPAAWILNSAFWEGGNATFNIKHQTQMSQHIFMCINVNNMCSNYKLCYGFLECIFTTPHVVNTLHCYQWSMIGLSPGWPDLHASLHFQCKTMYNGMDVIPWNVNFPVFLMPNSSYLCN